MTTILALDSSSENCSIAIYHQHTVSLCSEHAPRKHTQLILPLLKQELIRRELKLADVTAIAFGAGPGSFTGIRIAAGVAQGLAFGMDVPIYAISNLKALALQSFLKHGVSLVLACIDARMNEVYWGLFEVTQETYEVENKRHSRYHVAVLIDEQVASPEAVALPESFQLTTASKASMTLAAIGTGCSLLSDPISQYISIQDAKAQPDADTIAYLAETAIAEGQAGELMDALPSYVRDTVTWNKLPGRE